MGRVVLVFVLDLLWYLFWIFMFWYLTMNNGILISDTAFVYHHLNRGSATCLGLGGDGRGAPRIFLRRARDKVQDPPAPKISFLLRFHPLYFVMSKSSKIKNGKIKRMAKSGSGSPDTFLLTARVGTISEEI